MENIHIESRQSDQRLYRLFWEVSNTEEEDLEKLKRLGEEIFKSSPQPTDSFEAAELIRKFLINNNFHNQEGACTLQKLIHDKRGNCLSLTLLFGSILSERGFSPKYEIVLNPKDGAFEQEDELFNELKNGCYFSYDTPRLPRLKDQEEVPELRFAPLEHPRLILSQDRVFECTAIEDVKENPEYAPEAEAKQLVDFEAVASNVYVDQVKKDSINLKIPISEAMDKLEKALKLWPNNREAHSMLLEIAEITQNAELKKRSLEEYRRIGGDDSRFYFRLYQMTREIEYLDEALERAPTYLEAFMAKYVELEKDLSEAKFNFAVAANCARESTAYNLQFFYSHYKDQLERLYRKEEISALSK
ncbi:MAG: hypothetical protein EXS49_02730 [Candidatus Pacebacteria bacterium]|nr:hypothetical protein [Candidatus Paceibacterota bacterium]